MTPEVSIAMYFNKILKCWLVGLQWKLSIVNTIGTQQSDLIREVSLTENSMYLYVAGTVGSVLIREVSCIQGVLYSEVGTTVVLCTKLLLRNSLSFSSAEFAAASIEVHSSLT